MLFYANLQQPISKNFDRWKSYQTWSLVEDFSHFFSIIEEKFEEFGNVFGKK